MEKRFLIIAGEESGDKNAAKLIRRLKSVEKDVKVYAFAGKHSEREGALLVENITEHGAVGFIEIFDKISYYKNLRKKIVKFSDRERINNIILVDFPGFNLHIARILKQRGKKIFYYIVPQIWAWGNWRWKELYRYIDFALCIFPFEENILRERKINAFYVGHPLIEETMNISYTPQKVFSFLPGSRRNELGKLIPVYKKIAEKLYGMYPQHSLKLSLIRTYDFKTKEFDVYKGDARDILKISEGAFIASGTATLEAALIGVPFITLYKISNITYLLAKLFVKVKYASIVNILLDKEEIIEYIQNINIDRVVEDFQMIIKEKEKFKKISENLKKIFVSMKKIEPHHLILDNAT